MQYSTIKKIFSSLALFGIVTMSLTVSPVAAQSLTDDEFDDFFGSAPQASSTTTTTTSTAAATTTATSGASLTLPDELPETGSFDVLLITLLGTVFVSAGVAAAKTLFTTYE